MMPPPRRTRLRSILCAVDFSRQSAKALRYSVRLAAAAGGQVTAFSAIDPLLNAAVAAAYAPDRTEAGAAEELTRFVRRSVGDASGADIRTVVAVGRPGPATIAQASRMRASVIVMGTHGLRGFRRVLLGSTTEYVLRRFQGPVLAIPPHCREPRAGWPAGPAVVAIGGEQHRRVRLAAAARMADRLGAWLSLERIDPLVNASVPRGAGIVLLPLAGESHRQTSPQGRAAYRFVCGAHAPVMVLPGRRRPHDRSPSRRAA